MAKKKSTDISWLEHGDIKRSPYKFPSKFPRELRDWAWSIFLKAYQRAVDARNFRDVTIHVARLFFDTGMNDVWEALNEKFSISQKKAYLQMTLLALQTPPRPKKIYKRLIQKRLHKIGEVADELTELLLPAVHSKDKDITEIASELGEPETMLLILALEELLGESFESSEFILKLGALSEKSRLVAVMLDLPEYQIPARSNKVDVVDELKFNFIRDLRKLNRNAFKSPMYEVIADAVQAVFGETVDADTIRKLPE